MVGRFWIKWIHPNPEKTVKNIVDRIGMDPLRKERYFFETI